MEGKREEAGDQKGADHHGPGRPLVAIGGITLERAPAVMDAGADSIAVVSDIQRGSEKASAERVEAWLRFFSSPGR